MLYREYILDAITFATSLWAEGSEVFKAIVRTVPQTASLVPKVFPQGQVSIALAYLVETNTNFVVQVEGTVTQWADIEGQISTFIKTWGDDIGDAIELVQNVCHDAQAKIQNYGFTDLGCENRMSLHSSHLHRQGLSRGVYWI